jgi:tRNA nucleotidyltransferase (CCA-adding enzyme)
VTQYQSQAELSLTGDDLIAMGVSPGPVFQQVFKALRDARVNGQVNSKKDEISLVQQQFLQ